VCNNKIFAFTSVVVSVY